VDVADKLKEIWVLLAQDGFVAVLKKMPGAAMPTIKMNCVARQQPPHDRRNGNMSGPEKEVTMVGYECPSKTACRSLRQNRGDPLDEIVPVGIVYKYLAPLNSAAYDVVQCTWCVDACLSCHNRQNSTPGKRKKCIISWASLILFMGLY
jgi:hypothetical protein